MPRQAQAVTLDPLRAMLATLPNDLSGLRDRGLLHIGFAGGFRRAALCALDYADVTFVSEGLDVIIRKDKTDQAGQGASSRSPTASTATRARFTLRSWLDAAGINAGPIFRGVAKGGKTVRKGRLGPGSVARIVKRAADDTHAYTYRDPDSNTGSNLDGNRYAAAPNRHEHGNAKWIDGTLAEHRYLRRARSYDHARQHCVHVYRRRRTGG